MSNDQGEPDRTYGKLNRQQLEIYARELRDHMETERQLRHELEARNRELEERVREITGLNQLFRQHLDERLAVVHGYRDLLDGMSRVHSQIADLVKEAEALHLPEVLDLPRLDT